MRCSDCGAAWPVGSKFCGDCGAELPEGCPFCGHSNPKTVKFCLSCGGSLRINEGSAKAPPGPSLSIKTQRIAPTSVKAERRQITVLFCDMVGSTELSMKLDPEEQREVVGAFQACCATEIKRLNGMVAQFLGDGVLAYFGYPAAHEDNAERAARAGLAIIEAVGELRALPAVALQARIGIATGLVVVGDLVREGITQQDAAVGATTNLAARLQGLAEPNTIVIASDTHRLLGGLFEYKDLGQKALKGFEEPIWVHQVLRPAELDDRFAARHAASASPLLGREEELDLLLRRWAQTRACTGRVVLLTGEPGIGKSRLTRALRDQLQSEPHTTLFYQCSPHHQDSALYPVTAQLIHAAGIARGDPSERKLEKLQVLLAQSSSHLDKDLPLFARLLSIPVNEDWHTPSLSPQQLKERTLSVLLAHFEQLSARQPVLMVFEDLHWIDPTSLELLSRVVDGAPHLRVLLLATARPEFNSPWPSLRHVSTVPMSRLDQTEGKALVSGLSGGKALPLEVIEQIVTRTDGVPLFIEELTKSILESGALRDVGDHYELSRPLPPQAIPATLHASLLARLDRLSSVKDVAQIGAVIGREFSYQLLSAVAALPKKDLCSALAQLVGAELVFQRGEPPTSTYQFKHALVQDAAYSGLVRSRRQQLHAGIAHALETGFPDVCRSEPETLAHHFGEAQIEDRALYYLSQAGEAALARSAYPEAVRQLTKGLDILRKQLETPERYRQELSLLLQLAPAIRALKGFSAPETISAYSRARELMPERATLSEQISVLNGLWTIYHGRSEHAAAHDIAKQYVGLACRAGHQGAAAGSNRLLGQTLWMMGALDAANVHLQQAVRLATENCGQLSSPDPVFDEQAASQTWLARALWLLGYHDRALQMATLAVERARDTKKAMTIATSLFTEVLLGTMGASVRDSEEKLRELFSHCTAHGLGHYAQRARFYKGALQMHFGDVRQAVHEMRCGMAADEASGYTASRTSHLGLLAAAYCKLNEPHLSVSLLEEAIEFAAAANERFFEAELYRLKGEAILVIGSQRAQAEEAFSQALHVARSQGARLWELRAATSLAKLWKPQGNRTAGHELLAPVYGWFSKGAGLPELSDAKSLLEELESQSPRNDAV